jgi:hypothetical protein
MRTIDADARIHQLKETIERHLNIGFNVATQMCSGKVQVQTAGMPVRLLAAAVEAVSLPFTSLVSKAIRAGAEQRSKRQYQHLDLLLGTLDPRRQGMLSEKIARRTVVLLRQAESSASQSACQPALTLRAAVSDAAKTGKQIVSSTIKDVSAAVRDLLDGRERTATQAHGEELALAALSHVLEGKLTVEPVSSAHGASYREEQYDEIALELARASLPAHLLARLTPAAASDASPRDQASPTKASPGLARPPGIAVHADPSASPAQVDLAALVAQMAQQAAEMEQMKKQLAESEHRRSAMEKKLVTLETAVNPEDDAPGDSSGGGPLQQLLARRSTAASSRTGTASARATVAVERRVEGVAEDHQTLAAEFLRERERNDLLQKEVEELKDQLKGRDKKK